MWICANVYFQSKDDTEWITAQKALGTIKSQKKMLELASGRIVTVGCIAETRSKPYFRHV